MKQIFKELSNIFIKDVLRYLDQRCTKHTAECESDICCAKIFLSQYLVRHMLIFLVPRLRQFR